MMGTCIICRQFVGGDPVAEVGADRPKAEFMALAEAMRVHMGAYHKDHLPTIATLVTLVAACLASLFLECDALEFAEGREAARRFLADQIMGAAVVVTPATPVSSPLVVR